MCGIVGKISFDGGCEESLLNVMRDTMTHRGPDDAGSLFEGNVALAHRRLSIIDLSPGGHQPMTDGELRIVYNGEIYNYQSVREDLQARGHSFRTESDTEVILKAYREWGAECLSRFNGMFAFALYDAERQSVFLARDRAGKKPLFYRLASDGLWFASELKTLLADPRFPRRLNVDALDFYFAWGYVPGEHCILEGVNKLRPGHALTLDLNTRDSRVWQWWTLPQPPTGQGSTDADSLTDEYESLLEDAVRLRLIADVPVGVMLSGGLDSSLVTALAARVSSQPVKTFNISFPGHGKFDESEYARIVAEHFGTEHIELAAEPATVELLPRLAAQYDEPMADSSMVPTYLVSKLIREHATVALGGDGGDELFGGYQHYDWVRQQAKLRRWIPSPARWAMGRTAAKWLPVGVRGRNHAIGLQQDLAHSIAHVNMLFDHHSRRRLLRPLSDRGYLTEPFAENYKRQICERGGSPLQQATSVDFQTYMVDDILVKVDRASMLASLEVRAPFLDQRVVEFAFGKVPDELRSSGGQFKILSRKLGERLLPEELDLKRKQGFSLPLDKWFHGDWGEFMKQTLLDASPEVFDQNKVQALLRGQERGRNNMQRLFAVTLFELWRRKYEIEV